MKEYLPLLALPLVFMACNLGGDAKADTEAIQQKLDSSLTYLSAAGSSIAALSQSKFEEQKKKVDELKAAFDSADPKSSGYQAIKDAYDEGLKAFEEAKIEFLEERKEQIKAVYDEANAIIAELDGQMADLNNTRKDPMVTVFEVGAKQFKDYFRVKGNVEAKYNAQIFPELAGTITKLHVTKGDKVGKGQALIQVDTEVLRKQINEIESSLVLATDLYDRQKALWDQHIGSEVQYLEAKNRKESLENTKATLNEQLSMGTIRAPFAGVVDELNVKVGEMASPGFPVARVVNLDDLYIEGDVSENHFGDVKEGGEVLVSIQDADGVVDVPASISRVGSYIKPDNRTFEIRVDFDEENFALIPNLVADLKVNEFTSDTVEAYLPYAMIQENASRQNYVWVVEDAPQREDRWVAKKRIIEVGNVYEDEAHIISGLNPGDIIIDKGAKKMREGIYVRMEEKDQAILAQR